jgi:hypothetical protein
MTVTAARVTLFLDYDGVLHPDACYLEKGRPILRVPGSLFMWAPILVDILAPYPQVEIVLSTSWVRVLRFGRARDYLPKNLRTRVIGGTWHSAMARHPEGAHKVESWFASASRFEQIFRYVERAGIQPSKWVAIDDDVQAWNPGFQQCLICTDGLQGISDPKKQSELQARLEAICR